MPHKPFPQSFWVSDRLLCAGQYPGAPATAERDDKLRGLLDSGIRRVINLMEPDEVSYDGRPFAPYLPRLHELATERGAVVEYLNIPTRDKHAPQPTTLHQILEAIDQGLAHKVPTYLHCWGGHGRTGTAVACYLISRGQTPEQAIAALLSMRANLPKNHYPFEGDQERLVHTWHPQRGYND